MDNILFTPNGPLGSSGLLGGAFFCADHKTLAQQLAVEGHDHAPLNVLLT